MHQVNILEPNDPNIEYRKTTMYVSILDMQGEDAEMAVEDLSQNDKDHLLNFVKESMRGVHKMHPSVLVKGVKMEDGEFYMMLGSTIDDEFDVTSELIQGYMMSDTVQKKFPKINGNHHKFNVDLE